MKFTPTQSMKHNGWRIWAVTGLMLCSLWNTPIHAQTNAVNTTPSAQSATNLTAASANAAHFEEALKGLLTDNLNDKQAAVVALTQAQQPQTEV